MTTLSPWRADIITGSRLPAILELSPYNTREGVMREMVRDYFGDPADFTGNIATEWGNRHEADGIAEYEMRAGVKVDKTLEQQELVMHPSIPFLGYTPDGLVGTDGLVEVKCPYRALYDHIDQRLDHEVQIRTGLECTGRKWGDYVVWRPEGISPPSRVHHDPAWFSTVLGTLGEFMAEYRAIIADEKLAAPYRKPLIDVRTDEEWALAELDYLECLAAKTAAEKAGEQAKARLVWLAGDSKKTRGRSILLTRSNPSGSVSYKKALDKLCPDADLTPFKSSGGAPVWTARRSSTKDAT